MHKRLKAADPTMVEAPRGPAGFPSVPRASITARRISGADDPRAIKVKLAMVAFHCNSSTITNFSVFGSYFS